MLGILTVAMVCGFWGVRQGGHPVWARRGRQHQLCQQQQHKYTSYRIVSNNLNDSVTKNCHVEIVTYLHTNIYHDLLNINIIYYG